MKKWILLLLCFVLVAAFFLDWREQKKTNYTKEILDSISLVDLIMIKDSETEKPIAKYTNEDDFFNEMVNVYKHPYYELKQSERKLLKKQPVYVIEYLKGNTIQYKVNMFEVEEIENVFVDQAFDREKVENEYMYSPDNTGRSYVFMLEKYEHLVGLNDGLIQIINETFTQ